MRTEELWTSEHTVFPALIRLPRVVKFYYLYRAECYNVFNVFVLFKIDYKDKLHCYILYFEDVDEEAFYLKYGRLLAK